MQLNFSAPPHVKKRLKDTMKTQRSASLSKHILWCVEVGLRFAGKPPYTHEQLMGVPEPEVKQRAVTKRFLKASSMRWTKLLNKSKD